MKTIHHLKDIDFTIVAEPNGSGVVCKMTAYQIAGWRRTDEQQMVPFWNRKDWDSLPDPVMTLEEADVFLDGAVKFDGCSNWNFVSLPDMLIHFCCKDEAVNVGKLFGAMYDLAAELIAM